METILIRVDGGNNIGLGHLLRCISLADELKYKFNVLFLIKNYSSAVKILRKSNYEYIEINNNLSYKQELNQVKKVLNKNSFKNIITDAYHIDSQYLQELNEIVNNLITISIKTDLLYPSDIVINDNIFAKRSEYNSRNNTKFLLGINYKLMRKEFQNLPKRKINKKVNQIMISTGGGDPKNFTPKILGILNNIIDKNIICKVIIGPGFNNVSNIVDKSKKSNIQIELVFNTNKMSQIMMNSDIAITAGGTTLYELAATGTPAIAILQAENQIRNAEEMEAQESVINLGNHDNIEKNKLVNNLNKLINNYELRKLMSEKGQELVDGYGAKRCADKIIKLIES